MVYSWYRCSKALPAHLPFDQRLQACLFVCDTSVPQIASFLPEKWQQKPADRDERLRWLREEGIVFHLDQLLSFQPLLSDGIDQSTWLSSMLRQPRLFIRIRDNKSSITKILEEHNIPYTHIANNCLSLPNGANIDKILPAAGYVVQDASSQKTGTFFHPEKNEQWWDCCSGAGGKSLLLKDLLPSVKLTVSDKRQSILHNLKERFKLYGHKLPEEQVADVSDKVALSKTLKGHVFDHIICDVPCSGSGTWARTPEQLYYFEEDFIDRFSRLQKQIASNALSYLKPGGRLIYITCSVFKAENEQMVNHLLEHNDLILQEQFLINGISNRADSMFISILRKELIPE